MRRLASFTPLPFGPGGYASRAPVDFAQPYFYFQHGSEEEVARYREKIGQPPA
jgi:hypothetical protein